MKLCASYKRNISENAVISLSSLGDQVFIRMRSDLQMNSPYLVKYSIWGI